MLYVTVMLHFIIMLYVMILLYVTIIFDWKQIHILYIFHRLAKIVVLTNFAQSCFLDSSLIYKWASAISPRSLWKWNVYISP